MNLHDLIERNAVIRGVYSALGLLVSLAYLIAIVLLITAPVIAALYWWVVN